MKIQGKNRFLTVFVSVLEPLVPGANPEKVQVTKEVVKHGGLGILTAAIFLSGEMAGSGVLALPAAMIGTGEHRCQKCTAGYTKFNFASF